MYYLYISVNSLVKANSASSESDPSNETADTTFTKDFVNFTEKDMQGIFQIQNMGESIFKLLVNSLCPAIFGHEMVKGEGWNLTFDRLTVIIFTRQPDFSLLYLEVLEEPEMKARIFPSGQIHTCS